MPKSKVESIKAAIYAIGPDPDSTVLMALREVSQKAKDVSDNPCQEAGTSSNERVEEAKARVTRGGRPPVVGCGQSRCRADQSRF